jgi:hypothetical protein
VNEDQLRIGDAERERAAAELGEHYVQGRLTAEEHADRLERVWAARTRAEIGLLFRDLPGRYGPANSMPAPASTARRPTYWSGGAAPFRRGRPGPLVLVLVVLLGLTVITHLPVILVGGLVALFVLTKHRRCERGRAWGPHNARPPA